jgi:GH18 family chitinase
LAARLALGAILLLGVGQAAAAGANDVTARKPDRLLPIVGYLPDYRVEAIDPSVMGFVTDLIFFSIEPKPDGTLDARRLTPRAIEKLRTMRKVHAVRLLVALGGWGRSKGFAPVAASESSRKRFAANLARWCVEHGFDGADFDWEHPANRMEEESYAALLAEVKRAFRPDRLFLSVTLADWQNPGPIAYEAVDRVQIMSYDHSGPRHSTFAQAQADLETFASRGVPKAKICLGVPAYGRGMKNHHLVKTYAEIVRQHKPAADVDEVDGIWFNNLGTIRRKARFVKEHGFGGVMIWELGQDSVGPESLLRAIQREGGE